jgi:heptosyltransferase-1
MPSLLVVRPSSLGDVVYALALVDDVRRHRPDMVIDWVAEEAFAPLVRLDARIRRVVPIALRRWRRTPLLRATWREVGSFHRDLRSAEYTAVLDMQEQIKGAIVSRLARGVRHGFDRHSIREPLATLLDDVHHRVPRDIHFVDKCRALCGAALGYAVAGQPRWRFTLPAAPGARPPGRYAIVFHATSRADKLWPEDCWRALLAHLAQAGMTVLLPWGSADEEARSQRLAAGAAAAIVPDRQHLPALAALAGSAEVVIGVDTGLTHLAAALSVPTVAVFTATEPRLAGVARTGDHAVDVGGNGIVPTLADVIAAVGTVMRRAPRC